MCFRHVEQRAAPLLVADDCVRGPDPEVGGDDGHGHHRLAEVELGPAGSGRIGLFRGDQHDRCCGAGDMAGALPHGCQVGQMGVGR